MRVDVGGQGFHEPSRRRKTDFPVAASRGLENRRYEAERVHASDAASSQG